MKKFITIIVLFLTTFVSYAGEFRRPSSNTRNVGSVGEISGKTLIIVLYASYYDEDDISLATKKRFSDAMTQSLTWIEGEALKYGIQTDLIWYEAECDVKVSRDADLASITPEEICPLFFEVDYLDWIEESAAEADCNNYMVMVCTDLNSACKSHVAYKTSYDSKILESCVINMGNDSRDYACSISHEILHCFGAWDLYEFIDCNGNQVNLYRTEDGTEHLKKYLSNSVMMYNDDLKNVEIDKLTAYLIGLTNENEWWFYQLSNNGAR